MTCTHLLSLDDDMLFLVLMAMPVPLHREWLFVALASRALRRVALAAFLHSQVDSLCVSQLPGVVGNKLCVVGSDAMTRICTSTGSLMMSPGRFVFGKSEKNHRVRAFIYTVFPPNMRSTVARSCSSHTISNDVVAAHCLSTRAIFWLVRLAPLSIIRDCFFDVLSGGSLARLNITLRHHRALLMFSCMFGRFDVLDRLVHSDPARARAYDYEHGLLQMLDTPTIRVLFGWHPTISACETWAYTQLQVLVVRPVYMSNEPRMLLWLQNMVEAMASRRGLRNRPSLKHTATKQNRTFFLGLSIMEDCPCTLSTSGVWRSLHNALVEAAGVGATLVLEQVLTHARRSSGTADISNFSCLLVFSLLAAVLKAERNGESHDWLMRVCMENAKWFTALACMGNTAEITHVFGTENGSYFDFEDMLFVYGDSWYYHTGAASLMKLKDVQVMRDSILQPGDTRYSKWLMRMFVSPESTEDPTRSWFCRSVPKLTVSKVWEGSTVPRPIWWFRDGLCRLLVRSALRMRDIVCCEGGINDEQPEAHVYWNRLAETRLWLPHEGLLGPRRIDDGTALVFGHWLEHVVMQPSDRLDNAVHDATNDWLHVLCTIPAACLTVVESVCKTTLDTDQEHRARVILTTLLEMVVEHLMHIPVDPGCMGPLPRNDSRDYMGDRTCAVAYVCLMYRHSLLTNATTDWLLSDTRRLPDLHDALVRVLQLTHIQHIYMCSGI